MKRLLLILFLSLYKIAFADGSGIYVLKIEICTLEDETMTGFIKINDYVIDNYLDETKPETIKELLINHVQYTKKSGELSYFTNSIHYQYKLTENTSIGFNLYQLQNEKNISNKKIKAISIIDKKPEERELAILNKLSIDNQFWLEKEPITILNIGCVDEYCCQSVVIYSANEEVKKIMNQNENELSNSLYGFFFKQIELGQEIIMIKSCTE